jgi:hypothetical protein
MADIQESLNKIMEIRGAEGAAVVDYESGMTLGTIGGHDVDMELAGSANTEVVRTKKEIIEELQLDDQIEDLLITLDTQYHLIHISPVNENIFTYVVLDRDEANLGLARRKIEDIDESLQID